ncbi:MAG: DNA polymerase III subunit alpha [Candidatus Marinimicrobia bacterium]|nr:DNA polymerase III subunit alpha [Candidatus Neomarinimicrobiota bacterium]
MSNASADLLVKVCHGALPKRYDPITTEVLKRLTYELDIIIEMGYADYFLIVWDIVQWANKRGIATVGRGSAAGSMVSYLLSITPVDPMEHNLIFERFLNPDREEPPDIDVDLCWKRRDEVIEYVYERYGKERVAMISTFNTYRMRGAVRDVARAVGLSEREINRVVRELPLRYEPEGPENRRTGEKGEDSRYREIFELARKLMDRPRHMGIHCGGIVIAPDKITKFVPLQPSAKGPVVTQFDMHGVEKMGLVKIDLLGQRSLTVVAEMAEMLKRKYGVNFDPHTMPRMDDRTKALIRSGQTMGVFQIESPGMRGLLKKLRVDSFEMITAASSVIRPGPADSGMLRHFVKRHHGKEAVETVHPALTELLKETYGVMLYQEDVIKVAQAVAGWSLATSDKLRRSMSGKRVEEPFMKHRDRFIRDAVKLGVNVEAALEIWRQMEAFSGYAFCKAHSAAYSVISMQSAWLKAHSPAEFLAVTMSNYGGFYHTSCYLEEARRLGITIQPPDVNKTELHFTAEDVAPPWLRIGLLQVKGLTQAMLTELLEKRDERIFESLEDFCIRVKPAYREAETLIRCGAFDSFGYTRPQHLWRLRLFYDNTKHSEEGMFPDVVKVRSDPVPMVDYPLEKKLRDELELMELTVEKHPLWIWRGALREHVAKVGPFVYAREIHKQIGQNVTLVGWMVTTRRTKTKPGEMMQLLSCEDLTGTYEAVLFPKAYRKYSCLIRSRGPYIITGKVEDDFGHTLVTVEKLSMITNDGITFQHGGMKRSLR